MFEFTDLKGTFISNASASSKLICIGLAWLNSPCFRKMLEALKQLLLLVLLEFLKWCMTF